MHSWTKPTIEECFLSCQNAVMYPVTIAAIGLNSEPVNFIEVGAVRESPEYVWNETQN